eukprot:CAMPEP_0195507542 /NCGR_PEP_ID=MMETSP0794_2-20130614/972_1 /TAXON_ID=515487 /ORGANISM="Stephanopyxis turris, Strain CCMP 815" /LENGTH=266 /DNA_ID=CAMNT_0040634265 /DNA_START=124 /DNA_END=924 /DNA_ORIENTATION=+
MNALPQGRLSAPRRVWATYCYFLKERPLLTKCSTAGLIFFVSDLGTQYIIRPKCSDELESNKFEFDFDRSLSGASFGILGAGYLHFWWGWLETFAQARIPVGRSRLGNTLLKVAIDQVVSAPIYNYFYFFITNAFRAFPRDFSLIANFQLQMETELEGGAVTDEESKPDVGAAKDVLVDAHHRACDMIIPMMFKHWRIWPTVHTFNFYFVPLHHRVFVQNTLLVGWSGYLSYLNNGGLEEESKCKQERLEHEYQSGVEIDCPISVS